MTRIILLNGPRQVGKDFIASRYIEHANSARSLHVMWPAKLAAMAEYGITPSQVRAMELYKDEPITGVKDWRGLVVSDLEGKTPREVYIEYGDRMRAEEGEAYFANLWAQQAEHYRDYEYLLVPDVRFREEVEAAARTFGAGNTLLVRVHKNHYGWDRDVGSYLGHSISVDFDNDVDADVECPGLFLHEIVREFLS